MAEAGLKVGLLACGLLLVAMAGPGLTADVRRATPVAASKKIQQPFAGFTVAILGDAFADALAQGLRLEMPEGPDLAFATSIHIGLPLSSDARTDWPAYARTLLADRPAGLAVIMLGAADPRPIRYGDATIDPDDPRWRGLYARRIEALLDVFRQKGVPVIWVGLPIVADDGTASQYSGLNETIRDTVTKAGGRYIDSWGAFADEAGRYDAAGPDKQGQPARLRTSDGHSFTQAGAIKLASFVSGDLLHAQDDAFRAKAAATDVVLPREPEVDNDINAQIRREVGLAALTPSGRDAKGPVVVVTTPPLSPDGTLVPASIAPDPLPYAGGMSASQRALVEGRPIAPKPGRIDDFSWPRE